jgi:hypothetical protein
MSIDNPFVTLRRSMELVSKRSIYLSLAQSLGAAHSVVQCMRWKTGRTAISTCSVCNRAAEAAPA